MIRDALLQPPCVVSFSGGRDSSALLAVAVAVARREGLPDPVPATLIFPGAAESAEDEWQALVLRHLGVTGEWIRLRFADELDAVGPVAQGVLKRHGLVWPFNLHLHVPIMEAAFGGTVVTGFGGDEVSRSSAVLTAERLLESRTMPGLRDIKTLGYRFAPAPVRHLADFGRCGPEMAPVTWLTARGRLALRSAIAAEWATVPMGWSRLLRDWMWRSRYRRVCVDNFATVGRHHDARMVHPFVEGPVLQSLAAAAPFAGLGGRRDLLDVLVGDLLPRQVLHRPTKGAFSSPLWTATMREFATSWSGKGLDERFVEPSRVRAAWLSADRPLLSTTLLQAAWLADHGGRS